MRLVLLVAWREAMLALRRPMFWFYLALSVMVHTVYYFGQVRFGAGVASGGLGEEERVHQNGPYLLTLYHLVMLFAVSTLFAALGTASTLLRDRELGVESVLRGTHLSARQYILGKFLGVNLWIVGVTLLGASVGYLNDWITASSVSGGGAGDPRLFGSTELSYHLVALAIALPWLLFTISASFWLSMVTRSVMFTFLLVLTAWVGVLFLPSLNQESVQRFSEDTLNLEWKYVLGWIDPSGTSWLLANYGSEDMGVAYYNSTIPVPDWGFGIQRVLLLALSGFLGVASLRRYARQAHGSMKAVGDGEDVLFDLPAGPPELIAAPGSRSPVGWIGVMRLELRLLVRQIGVWVAGVMTMIFACSSALAGRPGAWGAEVHATSASAALGLVQGSTMWLCGLAAFLAIEVLNRERVTRFGDVFYASPVRSSAVLCGKVVAVCLTLLLILVATMAVTMGGQLRWHPTTPDPAMYIEFVGVLLVPGLLFFVALGSLCAVLFRDRFSAFGAVLLFALVYAVGLGTGWLDWRGVVVPSGFIAVSDITGLSPYREELGYNRAGVLATTIGLFLLTARTFRRTDRPLASCFAWRELRTRRAGLVGFAAMLVIIGLSEIALTERIDQGPNAEWREDRQEEYARRNRVKWGDPEGRFPEYINLELDVDLYPSDRRFELNGVFTLVNKTARIFPVIPLTVGPDWDIDPTGCIFEQTEDGEQESEVENRNGLYEVRLREPLNPGETCRLRLRYGGTVEAGARRVAGNFSHWILPEAVFLDSFGPVFLPVPGYVEPETHNEDRFDERATPEEMARMYEGNRRALLGGFGAYDVQLAVSVPEDMTALSAGVLVGEELDGDRRIFRYETDHPVYFFPIMAGRYETVHQGECVVYHSHLHPHNVENIAEALDQARRFYSRVYSPYPYQELRIVEFPGLAGFAMGHPTLIPFSESIGFLTKGSDGVSNVNFMVTAHEVAHQWWGNIVTPARAPGAAFLTEALAHYSTLLMEERFTGRVACRNRRREWERLYVEARRVDVERPIVRIDGSEPGDQPTWYNKGGWVFWMLSEHMGRENFLQALRALIEEFSFQDDHPTIHDLLSHVKAVGGDEVQPFLDQWFYEAVLPSPRVRSAVVTGNETDGFTTRIFVENIGSGTSELCVEVSNRRPRIAEIGGTPSPIRIEADDLPDPLGWEEEVEDAQDPDDPYTFARSSVLLPPEGEVELQVDSPFRPQWVVVDPDVQLLMSGRNLARVKIE